MPYGSQRRGKDYHVPIHYGPYSGPYRKSDLQGEGLHTIAPVQNGKDGTRFRSRRPQDIRSPDSARESRAGKDTGPQGALDHGFCFGAVSHHGRHAEQAWRDFVRRGAADAHHSQGTHGQSRRVGSRRTHRGACPGNHLSAQGLGRRPEAGRDHHTSLGAETFGLLWLFPTVWSSSTRAT